MHLGNGSQPAPVQLAVKPFPWPPFTLDLAATAAASAFNLLIVFAFLNPVRSVVVTIVREKELRLREGMRILGLTVSAVPCECASELWGQLELLFPMQLQAVGAARAAAAGGHAPSGAHGEWCALWVGASLGQSELWGQPELLCREGMRILGLTASTVHSGRVPFRDSPSCGGS